MATILRLLAEAVTTEFSTIKVGISTNPRPGTNFPLLFPDGVRYSKIDTLNLKSSLRTAIIANLGITAATIKTGNIFYIDTYMTTYPLSHQLDQFGETAGGNIDVEENTLSGVHLGLKGYASMGDHIHAWIYYSTLN